jgi:hypothetical protein
VYRTLVPEIAIRLTPLGMELTCARKDAAGGGIFARLKLYVNTRVPGETFSITEF